MVHSKRQNRIRTVAIIGCDGSGKSTQANRTVDGLTQAGFHAICIRPILLFARAIPFIHNENVPQTVSPRRIRISETAAKSIFTRVFSTIRIWGMRLMGYPYALAIYLFIRLYTSRNYIVICDRYFYQFFYDLYGHWADKIVNLFPKPDKAFFLDTEYSILKNRMSSNLDQNASEAYYAEVIRYYRNLAQRYNFAIIDANTDEDTISRLIMDRLLKEII